MLGIVAYYPEFKEIGCSVITGTITVDDIAHAAGFLTMTAKPHTHILNPEKAVTNLIESTNERLVVLNSPYSLPL
jgi:hypothetical protein